MILRNSFERNREIVPPRHCHPQRCPATMIAENEQPYRFQLLTDPQSKDRLNSLMGWRRYIRAGRTVKRNGELRPQPPPPVHS